MTQETTIDLITQIHALLHEHAPENDAAYPLSVSLLYDQETRTRQWWVYVHIRLPGRADFTLEKTADDPATALRSVIQELNRFDFAMQLANKGDRTFGIHHQPPILA